MDSKLTLHRHWPSSGQCLLDASPHCCGRSFARRSACKKAVSVLQFVWGGEGWAPLLDLGVVLDASHDGCTEEGEWMRREDGDRGSWGAGGVLKAGGGQLGPGMGVKVTLLAGSMSKLQLGKSMSAQRKGQITRRRSGNRVGVNSMSAVQGRCPRVFEAHSPRVMVGLLHAACCTLAGMASSLHSTAAACPARLHTIHLIQLIHLGTMCVRKKPRDGTRFGPDGQVDFVAAMATIIEGQCYQTVGAWPGLHPLLLEYNGWKRGQPRRLRAFRLWSWVALPSIHCRYRTVVGLVLDSKGGTIHLAQCGAPVSRRSFERHGTHGPTASARCAWISRIKTRDGVEQRLI
jgi:hypothetical protein